jgi:hypothetical protein
MSCPLLTVTAMSCPRLTVTALSCPRLTVTAMRCPRLTVTALRCPKLTVTAMCCIRLTVTSRIYLTKVRKTNDGVEFRTSDLRDTSLGQFRFGNFPLGDATSGPSRFTSQIARIRLYSGVSHRVACCKGRGEPRSLPTVHDFPSPTLTQHVTPHRRYILTILHGVMAVFVVTGMTTSIFALPSHVSIISVGEVLPKLRFSSISYHSTNAPYSHSFICHPCCAVDILTS